MKASEARKIYLKSKNKLSDVMINAIFNKSLAGENQMAFYPLINEYKKLKSKLIKLGYKVYNNSTTSIERKSIIIKW